VQPLEEPFGLYAGNVFQGIVTMGGKLGLFAEGEFEYHNIDRK
jgi:cobalt/nickel transport protein